MRILSVLIMYQVLSPDLTTDTQFYAPALLTTVSCWSPLSFLFICLLYLQDHSSHSCMQALSRYKRVSAVVYIQLRP